MNLCPLKVIFHKTNNLIYNLPHPPSVVISPYFAPSLVRIVRPRLLITNEDNPLAYTLLNSPTKVLPFPNLHYKVYLHREYIAISSSNFSNANRDEITVVLPSSCHFVLNALASKLGTPLQDYL